MPLFRVFAEVNAAALDTPADAIDTPSNKPGTYKGIIDCATKTFQKDGLARSIGCVTSCFDGWSKYGFFFVRTSP